MLRFIICIALFFGCISAEQIQVLAAASLKNVLEEIKGEFLKSRKGDKIKANYISSGKAFTQIQNGSKAELFVSADTGYPKKVFEAGLAAQEPQNYAKGKLVIFSTSLRVQDLSILSDKNVKHISMPNPKVAPYGVAAQAFLKNAKLDKKLKKKIVLGESIGASFAQVKQGGADVGFNALSMVIKDNTPNLTYIVIDQDKYEPILQSLVLTKAGEKSKLARDFSKFLLSAKAQEIFKQYGYDLP